MSGQQLRFDGEVFTVVRLDVPGFGKVAHDLSGDDPRLYRGDRIQATAEWVVVSRGDKEKFNGDGYGVEEPELVYGLQGIRPFVITQIVRRAEVNPWPAEASGA